MTKRELMTKYNICRLMPESELERELSIKEAELFEHSLQISKESFKDYFNETFADVVD